MNGRLKKWLKEDYLSRRINYRRRSPEIERFEYFVFNIPKGQEKDTHQYKVISKIEHVAFQRTYKILPWETLEQRAKNLYAKNGLCWDDPELDGDTLKDILKQAESLRKFGRAIRAPYELDYDVEYYLYYQQFYYPGEQEIRENILFIEFCQKHEIKLKRRITPAEAVIQRVFPEVTLSPESSSSDIEIVTDPPVSVTSSATKISNTRATHATENATVLKPATVNSGSKPKIRISDTTIEYIDSDSGSFIIRLTEAPTNQAREVRPAPRTSDLKKYLRVPTPVYGKNKALPVQSARVKRRSSRITKPVKLETIIEDSHSGIDNFDITSTPPPTKQAAKVLPASDASRPIISDLEVPKRVHSESASVKSDSSRIAKRQQLEKIIKNPTAPPTNQAGEVLTATRASEPIVKYLEVPKPVYGKNKALPVQSARVKRRSSRITKPEKLETIIEDSHSGIDNFDITSTPPPTKQAAEVLPASDASRPIISDLEAPKRVHTESASVKSDSSPIAKRQKLEKIIKNTTAPPTNQAGEVLPATRSSEPIVKYLEVPKPVYGKNKASPVERRSSRIAKLQKLKEIIGNPTIAPSTNQAREVHPATRASELLTYLKVPKPVYGKNKAIPVKSARVKHRSSRITKRPKLETIIEDSQSGVENFDITLTLPPTNQTAEVLPAADASRPIISDLEVRKRVHSESASVKSDSSRIAKRQQLDKIIENPTTAPPTNQAKEVLPALCASELKLVCTDCGSSRIRQERVLEVRIENPDSDSGNFDISPTNGTTDASEPIISDLEVPKPIHGESASVKSDSSRIATPTERILEKTDNRSLDTIVISESEEYPEAPSKASPVKKPRLDMMGDNPADQENHHVTNGDSTPYCNVATLFNMGNTCFLNSVLYTLRFAPTFLHNLHHLLVDVTLINSKLKENKTKTSSLGRSGSAVSGSSWRSASSKDLLSIGNNDIIPKTKDQIVTEKLHALFVAMNNLETKDSPDPYQPEALLQAIRDANSLFEGNHQQDAHEFFVELLSCLRVTCDKLNEQIEQYPDLVKSMETASANVNNNSKIWGVRKSWKKPSKKKDKIGSKKKADLENEVAAADSEENLSTDDCGDSNKKKFAYNFIAEDFQGVSLHRTKCLECEEVSELKEPFLEIQVPVNCRDEDFDRDLTESSIFSTLCVTSEKLCDQNKYFCEICNRYNEAVRTVLYEKLPNIMVLHLKRFTTSASGVQKVTTYVPTPLEIRCFCEGCNRTEKSKPTPHKYRLSCVIMHLGASMASGHYIAYSRASVQAGDYLDCKRDMPKSYLSSSGKELSANLLKFFKTKALGNVLSENQNGVGPHSKKNDTQVCQSLNCCGVRSKLSSTNRSDDWLEFDDEKISPDRRLRSSTRDPEDVKKQAFFRHIQWKKLQHRRVLPPFVPTAHSMKDVSNFDDKFTSEKAQLTPPKEPRTMRAQDQDLFKDFTYMAN